MTLCRYFLRGCCRYGDRCRFEHAQNTYESDRNSYSSEETQQNYRQQNYVQERYSRYDQRNDAYRYYSPEKYTPSPDNYSANYRYGFPERTNNHTYNSQDRFGTSYRYTPNRYSVDHRQNEQFRENYGSANEREDYSDFESLNSRGHGNQHHIQRNQNFSTNQSTCKTSTPSRTGAFSFKVPDAELKKEQNSYSSRFDGQDYLYADIINEDATAWELGKQWPFTCYAPISEKSSFPGFTDVSPEELRYEAYKAKENSTYSSYVDTVKNAFLDVENKRNQLKVTTPQIIDIVRKIRLGESLNSNSSLEGGFGFQQFNQVPSDAMVTDTTTAVKKSASAFSFKLPPDDGSKVKASASNFSFKLSDETDSKTPALKVPSIQGVDSEDYTPLEKLAEEEKEQFTASTFTLGKIPTKPPPHVLCF